MKKQNIISMLTLPLTLILLFSACSFSKTALSSEEFANAAQNAGYEVSDVSDEIGSEDIPVVQFATNENYQLEYYQLTDEDTAMQLFSGTKGSWEELHSVKTLVAEVNMPNYNYYTYTADGKYYVVSRIDNTLVCCIADTEYKDEISDFVKSLGYK